MRVLASSPCGVSPPWEHAEHPRQPSKNANKRYVIRHSVAPSAATSRPLPQRDRAHRPRIFSGQSLHSRHCGETNARPHWPPMRHRERLCGALLLMAGPACARADPIHDTGVIARAAAEGGGGVGVGAFDAGQEPTDDSGGSSAATTSMDSAVSSNPPVNPGPGENSGGLEAGSDSGSGPGPEADGGRSDGSVDSGPDSLESSSGTSSDSASGEGGNPICAGPNTPAECFACLFSGKPCQANGCFNGFVCRTTTNTCHAPGQC
jgi:hypothetical protein